MSLLATALDYAQRGWQVFPCKPREKVPATEHGFKDASRDPETIRQWWTDRPDANIGIACGASYLVVLDVDAGHDGRTTLERLERELGLLPQTVIAVTGGRDAQGRGGLHFYFSWPVVRLGEVARRSKPLAGYPGIDVKAAGGYVIAPGSTHPNGNSYLWDEGLAPNEIEIAPCPEWLLVEPDAAAGPSQPCIDESMPVREGARNDTLTRLAGAMRRHAADEATILAALIKRNEGFEPPLPAKEVKKIARSVARYESTPTVPTSAEHLTQLGFARRLVRLHGTDMRFCHPWNKWRLWDGTRWAEDTTGSAMRRAKEIPKMLRVEAASAANADERARLSKAALRAEQAHELDAALKLATSEPGISVTPDEFDADGFLLNVLNGTVDLRTGQLHEHRREDSITKLASISYTNARTPLWDAFLHRITGGDSKLIAYLQRVAGYCMTGDVREQCFFFLWGTGQNGKTVFTETLLYILGEYAGAAPPDLLTTKKGETHPTELASLFGKRMLAATETEAGRHLAECRVKILTGADSISARRMREDFWTFKMTAKLLIHGNHRPRIAGIDHGIWRRVRLVPFTVTIPEAERDKCLAARLQEEASGILAWAVRGCLDWQTSGLAEPEVVTQAGREYRAAEDVIGRFLEACCVLAPNGRASKRALRAHVKAWAEAEGERAPSGRSLAEALRAKGVTDARSNGQDFWAGVGVTAEGPWNMAATERA